jgi:ABC-type transport system substrate-binding protein
LNAFVLDGFWENTGVSLPCTGQARETRLAEAVSLLKSAGYTWALEPVWDAINNEPRAGQGLAAPGGRVLPFLALLAPNSDEDALRAEIAAYIAEQAGLLGLSLQVQLTDADGLLYAVYGSGEFDMAILGWRLSAYPAYLCDWFFPAAEKSLQYEGSRLRSACEEWSQSVDLEQARIYSYEAQSALMQDLPLIPLYALLRYDAYRNVRYPFAQIVDGLGGLYGAPALAIPIQ